MNISVHIEIETGAPRVPVKALRTLAEWMMRKTARQNPSRGWSGLDVRILNDRAMRRANAHIMRHEGPTDVISLAYRPMARGDGWHGEILINADCARALGPRFGGAARELALYLAHGCDHLSGANDAAPRDRARMRRRELRWLKAARAEGLLRPIERARGWTSC